MLRMLCAKNFEAHSHLYHYLQSWQSCPQSPQGSSQFQQQSGFAAVGVLCMLYARSRRQHAAQLGWQGSSLGVALYRLCCCRDLVCHIGLRPTRTDVLLKRLHRNGKAHRTPAALITHSVHQACIPSGIHLISLHLIRRLCDDHVCSLMMTFPVLAHVSHPQHV